MFTCKCISKFIQEFCWLDRQIHVHVPHLSAVPVCLVFAAWHLQDLCQGRPQWSKSGQKSSPKRVSCNSNTEILHMCVYICACISDFSEKMDQSNKWFFFYMQQLCTGMYYYGFRNKINQSYMFPFILFPIEFIYCCLILHLYCISPS